MNKSVITFLLLNFTACSTISEKAGKIVPNTPGKECPPQDERTLKDIFCKEPK